MSVQKLTRRQGEVLASICQYIAEFGYSPTIRELSARIGVGSTNCTVEHLDALERKGVISRKRGACNGSTRTIRVLDAPSLRRVSLQRAARDLAVALHDGEITVEQLIERHPRGGFTLTPLGCDVVRIVRQAPREVA